MRLIKGKLTAKEYASPKGVFYIADDTACIIVEHIRNKHLAERLVKCWNEYDDLVDERTGHIDHIDQLQTELSQTRPFSDCYKRVCESLGIKKNILGHVKHLQTTLKAKNKTIDELVNLMQNSHPLPYCDEGFLNGKDCEWCKALKKARIEE